MPFNTKKRKRLREQLQLISEGKYISSTESLVFGLLLATNVLVLGLCCALLNIHNITLSSSKELKQVFPAFRSFSFFVIYMWLLGLNVKVWNKYNINYKEIFKFNAHCSQVN